MDTKNLAPDELDGPEAGKAAEAKSWRARLWPAAKILITIGIFAEIGSRVDLHALANNVASASGSSLMIALGIFLFSPLLGGVRWWMVLRAIGHPAKLGPTTMTFWTGLAFSQILPNVAGEGIKIWIATRQGLPLKGAIHSVLFERLAMVLVLLLIVMLTEPLLAARAGSFAISWLAPLLLFAGFAGLAILATADRAAGYFGRVPFFRHVAELSADTRALLLSPWLLPLGIICALSNLVFIAAAWQVGEALRLSLSFLDYLAFIPLVTIATILPITVNGWGIREGLVIALFGRAGIAAPPALAFSILYGVWAAAVSLPGFFAWWLNPQRLAPDVDQSVRLPPKQFSQ